ncbi:MAG: DUF6506 family protein [Microbacteriaceae bacterium]|jgi:hypothetical protein|nr:DUF6506 family protein [Microbacteriaceae bacterium]MCI1207058.1 DUF6506 family protein [Microbacteriaceae bacterium]
MPLNAAFLFLSGSADPATHRGTVPTGDVDLHVVAVKNYAEAESVARELVDTLGVGAIELCGGFGIEGTARVQRAVGAGVPVGVVRFDHHPGLGDVSGDTLFA